MKTLRYYSVSSVFMTFFPRQGTSLFENERIETELFLGPHLPVKFESVVSLS
jgi:hypothetical protein